MNTKNGLTQLIFHGHFCQMDRKNPLTGAIDKQDSAHPWMNWNEKIYHDCYLANAWSRYLSPQGRILSISNNYENISFDFSVPLLSFFESEHPEFLEILRQTDADSMTRLGHGNAMACTFSHSILPLDKPRDAEIEISWGIESFMHFFKRAPEGLWLAECAISPRIVDLLAEYGIRFIILSPCQCDRIVDGNGSVLDPGVGPSFSESYLLEGKNRGRVACFFYNRELSEGISFAHMLRSADALYGKLLEIRDSSGAHLIHTATDGEIYGHYEPFADMALSALINKVRDRNDFSFTNYAAHLADEPPSKTAILKRGEDGKGTSWSCSHGLAKWYSDCGCSTSPVKDWNQKWRAPLRKAMDDLFAKTDEIFEAETEKVFSGRLSPTDLLKKAGAIFSGSTDLETFLHGLEEEYGLAEKDFRKISLLLLAMKNKRLSYASHGYGQADISCDESRQVIKTALYSISVFQNFYEGDLLLPFLSTLRSAKSNVRTAGDGMQIAEEEMRGMSGESEAALCFYLNRNFAPSFEHVGSYGCFNLLKAEKTAEKKYGITVRNTMTTEEYEFLFFSSSSIGSGINLYITKRENDSKKISRLRITNNDIPPLLLYKCYRWIDDAMNQITYNEIEDMSASVFHYSLLVRSNKYVPIETETVENLGVALKIIKSMLVSSMKSPLDESDSIKLDTLVEFIRKNGRKDESDMIQKIFSRYSVSIAARIRKEGLDDEKASIVLAFLELARRHGYEPDTTDLQNSFYPYYTGKEDHLQDDNLFRKLVSALNFEQ